MGGWDPDIKSCQLGSGVDGFMDDDDLLKFDDDREHDFPQEFSAMGLLGDSSLITPELASWGLVSNGDPNDFEPSSAPTSEEQNLTGTDGPFESGGRQILASKPVVTVNHHLIASLSRDIPSAVPKQIWEQGFLGFVFGHQSMQSFLTGSQSSGLNRLKRPLTADGEEIHKPGDTEPAVAKPRLEQSFFYARAMSARSTKDELARRQALGHEWAVIIAVNMEGYSLGRALLRQKQPVAMKDLQEGVMDSMGKKATSTLAKRLSAFSGYANWCLKNGCQIAPIAEHVAYHYVQHLVEEEASPSAGRSFLEAMHFCSGVFGLDIEELLTNSTRLKGLVEKMALAAPPVRPAEPLRVDQVMKLEQTCVAAGCDQDTCTIGGMLVLLYGCARVSDGARAVSIAVDIAEDKNSEFAGYVELSVASSKTAISVDSKRRLLPVLAPLYSLSGFDWITPWLDARQRLGLDNEGELIWPFIPKFGPSGDPVNVPALSAELGKILRLVLGVASSPPNTLRSHSLKATPLSWAAKYGLSLTTRRTLGHHSDPGAKSADLYARDPMGAPVGELTKVLRDIKRQHFLPDRPRTGRFPRASPVASPEADSDTCDSEAGRTDDSSGADTEDSTDVEDTHEVPDNGRLLHLASVDQHPVRAMDMRGRECHRHKVSGVQHVAMEGSHKLLCGRIISANYVLTTGPWESAPVCATCVAARSKDL